MQQSPHYQSQLHLSELPSVIVEYGILEFLDPKSLIQMSLTNRQFHREVHQASSPWASIVASHFGISTQLFEQTHGVCDWRRIFVSLMWTKVLVLQNLDHGNQFLEFLRFQAPSTGGGATQPESVFEPQWPQEFSTINDTNMRAKDSLQDNPLFEVDWSNSLCTNCSGNNDTTLSLHDSEVLYEILVIEALRRFPHSVEIVSLYAELLREQKQQFTAQALDLSQ